MYQRDNILEGDYSKIHKRDNFPDGEYSKIHMREIVYEGGYAKSLRGESVPWSNIPGVIKCQGGKDVGGRVCVSPKYS